MRTGKRLIYRAGQVAAPPAGLGEWFATSMNAKCLRPPAVVGALLDSVAEPGNRLWPSRWWPPMRLDGPIAVGATGGHGPIHYEVIDHVPGQEVRFGFLRVLGMRANGSHLLEIAPGGHNEATLLRHVLEVRPSARLWVSWHLAIRFLHDALIEDLLDNAAETCGGPRVARWPLAVRALRFGFAPLLTTRR